MRLWSWQDPWLQHRLAATRMPVTALRCRSRFRRRRSFLRAQFAVAVSPEQIANVEEADVKHVTDDQGRAAALDPFEDPHVHRFAPHAFDDRQDNVAAVENWNRKHVQD